MPEIIRIGTMELRFLLSKHDTNGSLDLFEMTVPPSGPMPVPPGLGRDRVWPHWSRYLHGDRHAA
jgi:hypothetical protein